MNQMQIETNLEYASNVVNGLKICLDCETTGVKMTKEEILSLAIVNIDTDEVIYNKKFKPVKLTEWPEAEAVNHISPEDVKDCPHIMDCKDEIVKILNEASLIIGYNIVAFDLPFLKKELDIKDRFKSEKFDVMNEWSKNFTLHQSVSIRWTLLEVAEALDIPIIDAHDALGDVRMTVAIYKKMIQEMRKPRLDTTYKVGDKEIYSYTLAKKYAEEIGQSIGKSTYFADNKIIDEEKTVDGAYWTEHDYINKRKEKGFA